MYIRAFLILTAFWAFVAMPALCEGGLLLHLCSQHDSSDCGHESDCHDDPCAKFIADRGRSGPRADSIDLMHPIACPEPIAPAGLDFVERFFAPLDRLLVPLPEPHITLPLLI